MAITADEWVEVVEWVEVRFPKGWHAEQATAYYFDVQEFDATDVWSALLHIYNQGVEFAPNGSQLRARAKAELRDQARRDQYAALPEPDEDAKPVVDWLVQLYPGEQVDWDEHVRRVHAKRIDCRSHTCDIHNVA